MSPSSTPLIGSTPRLSSRKLRFSTRLSVLCCTRSVATIHLLRNVEWPDPLPLGLQIMYCQMTTRDSIILGWWALLLVFSFFLSVVDWFILYSSFSHQLSLLLHLPILSLMCASPDCMAKFKTSENLHAYGH